MGLLALLKGEKETVAALNPRAIELSKKIGALEGQLRLDWNRRMKGDGVYVGYVVLRQFYRGQQWSYQKENGGTMRTYNYCFTVVENMTAFLTNEAPQMSSPARDISNPIEQKMAEGRSKLLKNVHDNNSLSIEFQKAVRTASINGDAFVFGPIPTFKVNDKGEKKFDNIRYWNVERPENIRPIWKDENFSQLAGFINWYRIEVQTANRLFAEELKECGMTTFSPDTALERLDGEIEPTEVPMVTIKAYWDEQEYLLEIGNKSKILDYAKHDWGFVPLHHIPNIHQPGLPYGTSDLENELDPQQEYNERSSDLGDIIKELAQPTYWGKNIDNMSEVRSGVTTFYSVGDDAEINAMPKSGSTGPVENYLSDRKNDIVQLSGMNQVLYPGNQVLQSTGRALSVVMQGVNNKISLRKEWWIRAFREINREILFLAEKYIPNANKIIDGYYDTDVFISSVLLRSVSDEINKFQAKLQSLRTTQQNVGIPSPSEEQKLMKEELEDEILATEIAKQPGLLHQIIAERQAAAMQAQQQQADIKGQPPGIANESENEAREDAVAFAGKAPAMSPEGAVRAMAQRSGAPSQLTPRK